MIRNILVLILMVLAFQKVSAQTKDTIFYLIKKSGRVVTNQDSADYLMMNMPGDTTNSGIWLFPVIEVYRDGKRKLTGTSLSRLPDLKLEGICTTFFPNGQKQSKITYKSGLPVGEAVIYYPNGQLYAEMTFDKNSKAFLKECRDSTGRELVKSGEGRWPKFDEDYKKIIAEGPVINGVEEGEWRGIIDDATRFVCTYHEGNFVSGTSYDKSGKAFPFTSLGIEPTFKGGITAFYAFLMRQMHYPTYEKENNIQGKVFISFMVEKDGTLSDAKVVRAPTVGLGQEALRVIKLSPKWIAAKQYGLPVRAQYTIPVNFTLTKDN